MKLENIKNDVFQNKEHASKADELEAQYDKVEALVKEYDYQNVIQTNLRNNEYPKYLDSFLRNNPGAAESEFMKSAEGKNYDLKSREINTKLNKILSKLSSTRAILASLGGQV